MEESKMIDVIIFSYNRAMQLNTLIESLYRYFQYSMKISVLYNCTPAFNNGYELLKARYTDVRFIKEKNRFNGYSISELVKIFNIKRFVKYRYIRKPKSDFRSNLIALLENSDARFVMFLTDDSVFIKPVCLDNQILEFITEQPENVQYSLRLGRNVNKPVNYVETDDFISWSFYDTRNDRDWIYHFSVDAHIYDRKFILALAKDIIFSNPNSYEAFTKIRITQYCFQKTGYANLEPSIISFPINMVQNVQDNESLSVSTELLEKYFLEGYTLRYNVPDNIDAFQYYPDILFIEKDGIKKEINTKSNV